MSGSFSGADKASLAYSGEYDEAYGRKLSLHAVLDGHGGKPKIDEKGFVTYQDITPRDQVQMWVGQS
jgi:hypothetical protein